MLSNPVLLMTVGLPRSGKSTWARKTGFPVVNPDSIRMALHGQAFYGPAEAFVWATAHLMVASLFRAGHAVVVLDATNVSCRRRDDWRSKEWNCGYVVFKASMELCIERARRNNQPDLIPIIERMHRNLEWPVETEVGITNGPSGLLHYVPAAR